MIAHTAQLTLLAELEQVMDMVTMNAARAARLADYGLAAGRRADLVVVDATSVHEALRLCHVIFGGREGGPGVAEPGAAEAAAGVSAAPDQLEAPVDDGVRLLRAESLGEAREAGDVGEQQGDLAALALEGRAALQDLVGEMPGV